MRRSVQDLTRFFVFASVFVSARTFANSPAEKAAEDFFESEIRPLLLERCVKCHGAKKQESDLRLDSRSSILRGGASGPAVAIDRAAGSSASDLDTSLLLRVVRREGEIKMPPRKALEAREVSALERWVKLGLPWPDDRGDESEDEGGGGLRIRSGPITDAERAWWSFQPVVRPDVPEVPESLSNWCQTPIDRFILASLSESGLRPVQRASRHERIRRVTLDLTGLPPTPSEVRAFLADKSPHAFEEVVDRLLRSRHYGERWGRHWLDVVRYADTAGETADYPTTHAWRFRNWVIDAFNSDKPYDEFVREQLAGDILAKSLLSADGGVADDAALRRFGALMTATGYLAISRRFGFAVEPEHFLTIHDTIDATGQAFLGLSVGCARCHDHKFDPINTDDYYAWYGIFESTSYSLSGDEGTKKERRLYPSIPPKDVAELDAKKKDELEAVELEIASLEAEQKSLQATLNLVATYDPTFETQVLEAPPTEPWHLHTNALTSARAQSPYVNAFPRGTRGVEFPESDANNSFGAAVVPPRTLENSPTLYYNVDFQNRADVGKKSSQGAYRFYVGHGSGVSAAVEMGASATEFFVKDGSGYRAVRKIERGRWYNVQLTLDLRSRTYSGTIGSTGDVTRFESVKFVDGWDGIIDRIFVDRYGPRGGISPGRRFDNFAIRPIPFLPVGESVSETQDSLGDGFLTSYLAGRSLSRLASNAGGHVGFHVWMGRQDLPSAAMNISNETRLVPGVAPPNLFMVHPGQQTGAGVLWSSPIDGYVRVRGFARDRHDCGNGVEWFVDHLSAGGFSTLAAGHVDRNNTTRFESVAGARLDQVRVRPGDCLQVVIFNRGDLGCDQTQIDLRLEEIDGERRWNLAADVAARFHESSSLGDRHGNARVWSYFESPVDRALVLAATGAVPRNAPIVKTKRERQHEVVKRLEVLRPRRDELSREHEVPVVYGAIEHDKPADSKIHLRGDPKKLGARVERRDLEILGAASVKNPDTASGRLDFANWVTRPRNPLTARVMVNRIWHYHFGRGLVETPNDFGTRGRAPSHPKLLDWLAAEFVARKWSVKDMHRLILRSSVYQLASRPRSETGESVWLSPAQENERARLFGRFVPRRLEAEAIRDSMLAVSGLLDRQVGGPHPFPPASGWGFSQHAPFYAEYPTNKRSVYLMAQRLKRHPYLTLFDGADTNASTASRTQTTTPTQALFLLNSEFVHEQSRGFAVRVLSAATTTPDRIGFAYELAFSRRAESIEVERGSRFVKSYESRLAETGVSEDEHERLAWEAFARTLLVRNEFLFLD